MNLPKPAEISRAGFTKPLLIHGYISTGPVTKQNFEKNQEKKTNKQQTKANLTNRA